MVIVMHTLEGIIILKELSEIGQPVPDNYMP